LCGVDNLKQVGGWGEFNLSCCYQAVPLICKWVHGIGYMNLNFKTEL
jgi:hypothetical protein